MATIYAHYEPSELEAKHFTSEDEKLRQTDVPERLQLRKGTPYDERSLQEEAEWIYKRVFVRSYPEMAYIIPKVGNVLRFLQEQNFEVPFISTYRKDYYQPLKIPDLWEIYDWDEKWAHLQTRKANLAVCPLLYL